MSDDHLIHLYVTSSYFLKRCLKGFFFSFSFFFKGWYIFTSVFLDIAHLESMFLATCFKSFNFRKVGQFLELQILVYVLFPCFGFPLQRLLLSIQQSSFLSSVFDTFSWICFQSLCFFCNLQFPLFTHSVSIRAALYVVFICYRIPSSLVFTVNDFFSIFFFWVFQFWFHSFLSSIILLMFV